MTDAPLEIGNGYHLSGLRRGDEDALVAHLADGRIGEMIPVLPYPYGRSEAQWWVRHRAAFREQAGVEMTFAIRRPDGFLVGSVGADDYPVGERDSAELGYWVAPAERGRGLGTRAVAAFITHAFETLGLARLTAAALACNTGSLRLHSKTGFRRLGSAPEPIVTRAGTFEALLHELIKGDTGRHSSSVSTAPCHP